MRSSLVQWAAVALFICPYHTRAFVPIPGPCSPNLKTKVVIGNSRHGHGNCHRRDSLRLQAGVGGGGEGGGGDAGDGEKKPPRSVLQRPWDVEVDLHGERHIITVQPGDSILEAWTPPVPGNPTAGERKLERPPPQAPAAQPINTRPAGPIGVGVNVAGFGVGNPGYGVGGGGGYPGYGFASGGEGPRVGGGGMGVPMEQNEGGHVGLPGYIEVRINAADGRRYYVNHRTQVTTWMPPPREAW